MSFFSYHMSLRQYRDEAYTNVRVMNAVCIMCHQHFEDIFFILYYYFFFAFSWTHTHTRNDHTFTSVALILYSFVLRVSLLGKNIRNWHFHSQNWEQVSSTRMTRSKIVLFVDFIYTIFVCVCVCVIIKSILRHCFLSTFYMTFLSLQTPIFDENLSHIHFFLDQLNLISPV